MNMDFLITKKQQLMRLPGRASLTCKTILVSFMMLLVMMAEAQLTLNDSNEDSEIKLVKVFYEKGKFGGWPANWGMWNWGKEILVGYSMADHKDTTGHNYDPKTSLTKFSRSLDGGLTWKMEDAYESGITESTWENNLHERSKKPTSLQSSVDFKQKDFAFSFRMRNAIDGGTSFYYSYNRGKNWKGPYDLKVEFPGRKPAGIVSRTDYIIEGKNQMTAFLTVGFREGDKNWREVACVRTTDGGKSWKHISWIGPEGLNSIMPASLRLGPNKLLTIIRRTKPPEMVSFLSEDNGKTWTQIKDPVKVDANGHPPALLKLKDGSLCLVYGIRVEKTMPDGIGMYVTFSNDEGKTWGPPRLLQGKDGGSWDIGYPRAVQLPDGKVVATYYYNNSGTGDKYRYISAAIFDPNQINKK
jgi:hypothetical protein